jgi:hypothetical protein
VLAFAIVENLQRPPWVRRIENFFAKITKKGTYGVMQVSSTRGLSDEESVDQAVKTFFLNTKNPSDHEGIVSLALTYNHDIRFAEEVANAYFYISRTGKDPYPNAVG